MEFKKFKAAMQQHFQLFTAGQSVLFLTDVDKDVIWDTYLLSFPEEERQVHTCNSCKQFLRPFANVVSIVDNKIKSIWDFECDEPFQTVVKALDKLVIAAPVRDVFVNRFPKMGVNFNHETLEDGSIITWDHIHLVLPKNLVTAKSALSEESIMGTLRTKKETFKRALDEITVDALETVIDLINQNSLYRGQESLIMVDAFLTWKKRYMAVSDSEKDNYCWIQSTLTSGAISGIRNTSIGTLLVDVSKGVELDHAVGSFERMMAPANYKRPTALLTTKMIESAQAKLVEMGLVDSLGRRYAVLDDITVNNVLFVNRDTKKAMNVFDDLSKGVAVNVKALNKTEEIGIEDFITNVLPTATNIEMIIENTQMGNFMSLIAPTVKDSKPLFKWDNSFSWTYANDVADSIKEKVKAQGGNVKGCLRFSIMWAEDQPTDNSDLDAHCIEPNGTHIYYRNLKSPYTEGNLDVDIRQPANYRHHNIVENITYPKMGRLLKGKYNFSVHGYAIRGDQQGFNAEIEFDGQLYQYHYPKKVKPEEDVQVATVEWTGDKFVIVSSMQSDTNAKILSKDSWGVKTNQYQKVNMIMASPNHWDGKGVGNKHYFFMLDGCKNPDTPRGFFNEYLKDDFMTEKRVFEALGNKMRVAPSDTQLSGVGFSTTTRASIIVKVEGTFNRVLKINF
jgi:hypothetical protein